MIFCNTVYILIYPLVEFFPYWRWIHISVSKALVYLNHIWRTKMRRIKKMHEANISSHISSNWKNPDQEFIAKVRYRQKVKISSSRSTWLTNMKLDHPRILLKIIHFKFSISRQYSDWVPTYLDAYIFSCFRWKISKILFWLKLISNEIDIRRRTSKPKLRVIIFSKYELYAQV